MEQKDMQRTELFNTVNTPICRFGIVNALTEEFAAMCAMLENPKLYAVPGDLNDYMIGSIPAADLSGSHSVVVTLLKKAGNNSAAAAASHLLRSFPTIEEVLMVGIAGGCPCPEDIGKHVRLGDLVVSNEYGVVQYDNVKLSQGRVELRDTSAPPSAALLGKVRLLEAARLAGKKPWIDNITRASFLEGFGIPPSNTDRLFASKEPDKRLRHPTDPTRVPGQPKLHYGRIGAANTLLKNPVLRDALRDKLQVRAIEMEGSGIADSTWSAKQSYILIRGICDYCDSHKNDKWHLHASIVAAAYARALIAAFPAQAEATHVSQADAGEQNSQEVARYAVQAHTVQGLVMGDNAQVTMNYGKAPEGK